MTDQGLLLECDRCGSTLDRPGPLVFGSPDRDGFVRKVHICADCELALFDWVYNPPTPKDDA